MEDQKMDKLKPEEPYNKAQTEKHRSVSQDCISYCTSGIMSRCRAGSVWPDQQKCKYYKKSTTRNKCMHYIEALGGHCDCEAAQRESRRQPNRNEDEI
jgi:hypothetical protein